MSAAFDEREVARFARALVDDLLGEGRSMRVFVAGGMYKTLLHGRPPRDVDLWAPTPADQLALIERIRVRGGVAEEKRLFSQSWRLKCHIVDIPDKAEPDTLERRLAQFDIALSAIGVELTKDEVTEVRVHPLARDSVSQREILLLKPLANWKHALATLARMRSYAVELGYASRPEEEETIWNAFDAQDREMKESMIARFIQVASQENEIVKTASRRLGGGTSDTRTR